MRLVAEYAAASSALHTAVTNVRAKAGKESLKTGSEVAQVKAKCVQARLALRDHKAQHGC